LPSQKNTIDFMQPKRRLRIPFFLFDPTERLPGGLFQPSCCLSSFVYRMLAMRDDLAAPSFFITKALNIKTDHL
jgi:hypothetical protein